MPGRIELPSNLQSPNSRSFNLDFTRPPENQGGRPPDSPFDALRLFIEEQRSAEPPSIEGQRSAGPPSVENLAPSELRWDNDRFWYQDFHDDSGNVIQTRYYDSNMNLVRYNIYENLGHYREWDVLDAQNNLLRHHTHLLSINGSSETIYDCDESLLGMKLFDLNENLIREDFYDDEKLVQQNHYSDGKLDYYERYIYDENRRCKKEVFAPNGRLLDEQFVWERV
jgi:hypothetical protein